MDVEEDYSKGRASSLFMFVVLSGITLVLALIHWLSDLHISLVPLYAWEIILFAITLLSIVCFFAVRNNSDHVIDESIDSDVDQRSEFELSSNAMTEGINQGQTSEPLWMRFPSRHVALFVCCIGSISMPVYEIYRTSDNLSCFVTESTDVIVLLKLKITSNVFYVLACVSVMGFLLRFWKKRSKSPEMKVLMASLVATNITLIINVIMDIIWTSNTMEVNSATPLINVTNTSYIANTKAANMTDAELVKEVIYIKCENNIGYVDTVATYFYKYSYQFPVQFALLSFCFLGTLWNVLPKRQIHVRRQRIHSETQTASTTTDHQVSRDTDIGEQNEQQDPERQPLIRRSRSVPPWLSKLRRGGKATFVFICNWITILTTFVVTAIFAFHLYTEIEDDTFDDENVILRCDEEKDSCADSQNSIIQTIYIYVISIVAFIGFMVARKETKTYDVFHAVDIVMLICAGGRLILILFETIDNIEIIFENNTDNTTAEVLFSFKTFCRYIGLYSQTILVLKVSKIKFEQNSMTTGKHLFIKAVIAFLGVCNLEIWLADSFLEPTVLQYNENTNYGQSYGRKNWFYLTQLLYPFLTLYRLLSAIMCYEACVLFKRKQLRNASLFNTNEDQAE